MNLSLKENKKKTTVFGGSIIVPEIGGILSFQEQFYNPLSALSSFLTDSSSTSILGIAAGVIILALLAFVYYGHYKFNKEIKNRSNLEKIAAEKEESLRRALSLSQATLEATADGILVVDEERKIAGHNQLFRQMWKIPESVMITGNDEEAVKYVLSQVKDPAQFIANLDRYYNLQPDSTDFGLVEFADGRIFERYTMPQRLDNQTIGRVFSFRDVTKRKELEGQLIYQATYDALTRLPNRVLLEDRLNQAIRRGKRSKSQVAVLFFDLDRFKLVNDSLGHNVGDILLQAVASRLESCVRECDTLARWGGDEFVIILSDVETHRDIIPIIDRCQKLLAEVFKIESQEIGITSSVGVSIFPADGKDVNSLLKNSDSAMYNAKGNGPNCYSFYRSDMNARAVEMLELERDLRYALENNEFVLHYQPMVELENNTIVGMEALIRWIHPKKGLIPPLDFIELAEETGLIIDIGEWVLRTACVQNKQWQKAGLPKVTMSVNLSSHQFRHKDIVSIVADALKNSNLDPQYLELELTESSIMGNTELYLRAMESLKDLGVSLSIDDFGTGYSSLSYLQKFPVSKLKIDRAFVKDLATEKDDGTLALAIIALAQKLKLKVIAEGAETEEQVKFLKQNQCNEVQGYYFSKPVEASHFEKLLKEKVIKPQQGLSEPKSQVRKPVSKSALKEQKIYSQKKTYTTKGSYTLKKIAKKTKSISGKVIGAKKKG
jgi:diguanylate cyclase (GGDEF)-like protein